MPKRFNDSRYDDFESGCFRCGREGHWASECFAKTKVRSETSSMDCCFRCGREGHWASECYAKTSVGNSLTAKGIRGVYCLTDSDGKLYVGKSDNISERIDDHKMGEGTRFLGQNLQRIAPETTPISDLESWERNETLTMMYKRGIENVRGWMFTTRSLSDDQKQDAFSQICEKFDLCRKCGRDGHFVTSCFARSKADWAK
jgi:hypothetical protein